MKMLAVTLLVALLATLSHSAPAAGPVKISDNNIENIYNINININGIFTNSVQQDIVNVVTGILNQQGGNVELKNALKEQLKALVAEASSNDVNIDVPVSAASGIPSFDFSELVKKLPATADFLKKIPEPQQEAKAPKVPETPEVKAQEENNPEPQSFNDLSLDVQEMIQKVLAEANN